MSGQCCGSDSGEGKFWGMIGQRKNFLNARLFSEEAAGFVEWKWSAGLDKDEKG
jgi:hypothetical protein